MACLFFGVHCPAFMQDRSDVRICLYGGPLGLVCLEMGCLVLNAYAAHVQLGITKGPELCLSERQSNAGMKRALRLMQKTTQHHWSCFNAAPNNSARFCTTKPLYLLH
eukprot:m.37533 g.37533  ORF g.37533 m.37533 type:complete len:108 (-) comp10107_c0_seq1:1798-2121(-)